MSGEILEIERSAFEELERIEKAITDRIIYNPKILPDTLSLSVNSSLNGKRKRPLRETVLHEIEISKFIDRYQEQCKYLNDIFNGIKKRKQDDGNEQNLLADQHKAEINLLGKYPAGSSELLDQYYQQIKSIKEFHHKYPNEGVEDLESTYAMAKTLKKQQPEEEDSIVPPPPYNGILSNYSSTDINLDTIFSGEEYYGKFIDLITHHERYLNLPFRLLPISYVQYLDKFSDFHDKSIHPSNRLSSPEYFEYIVELHKYIESFFIKTRILAQPESSIKRIEQEFDSLWESERYPGWIEVDKENEKNNTTSDESDPLFCTPCDKKFSNQALFNNHLTGRKHKRNAANKTSTSTTIGQNNSTSDFKLRAIASHEYSIYSLSELLTKLIAETKSNVERRQALTDKERQTEVENLEKEAVGTGNSDDESNNNDNNDDDNSDDEVIYNPLKLPLGWDGKPIPFWLYKYQGLGVEFECEICGNQRYAGRKAFDKHFLEPRHVHGLKCLGIEPDPLFKGITNLSDAMTLWEKIKQNNKKIETKQESTVEMEDDEGNVMSERVYNDLKKQGLI